MWQQLLNRRALPRPASRALSVVAWGRNTEGQCSVEGAPLVLRPATVAQLEGEQPCQLAAGKLTSAVVTSAGEAWTWGDGCAGKLGHGGGHRVPAAARVESLVGRSLLSSVVLADSHTLFLDTQGAIWSCGENKEGQLGLGTPVEVIAQQHRRAYYASTVPGLVNRVADAQHRQSGGGAGDAVAEAGGSDGGSVPPLLSLDAPRWHIGHQDFRSMQQRLKRKAATAQQAVVAEQRGMDNIMHALGLSGIEKTEWENNMQPGQLHYPTRVGMDNHPLGMYRHGGDSRALNESMRRSLEEERVIGVAASSYFSAAVTSKGEVWTFGACFNGCLGGNSDWSTSAQRVGDELALALQENGGAVRLVAGGTFCAAMTSSGKVVVWGKVPKPHQPSRMSTETNRDATPGVRGGSAGNTVTVSRAASPSDSARISAAIVPGLPSITHIAAGRQHLLMSDGEAVWGIGRWMDEMGDEVGGAEIDAPVQLLRLSGTGESVTQLSCGPHCSGVVTSAGRVWMWGRLLEEDYARSLIRGYHAGQEDETRKGEASIAECDWAWGGFGASQPRLVSGLHGVKSLALGGWHALAVVE